MLMMSCVHTTPFVEEPYFRTLGAEGELVVTMNLSESREVLAPVIDALPSDIGLKYITERSDRFSLATQVPGDSEKMRTEDTVKYYGAVEGNLSSYVIQNGLSLGNLWEKHQLPITQDERFDPAKRKPEHLVYWQNTEMDLQVSIPENGIVLFANEGMEDVYRRTYLRREMFIPADVAEHMQEGILSLYMERPHDLVLLNQFLPQTLINQIDSVWFVLHGSRGAFALDAVISTQTPASTRVMVTMLKVAYLARVKKMDPPPDDWKDSIQSSQDTGQVTIRNMYLEDTDVNSVFSLLTSLFQEG